MPRSQIADELENAYRSEVWNPGYSHLREQKQGVKAARVELSSSSGKVKPAHRRLVKPAMTRLMPQVLPCTPAPAQTRLCSRMPQIAVVWAACRACTRCLQASSRSTSAPTRRTPGSAGAAAVSNRTFSAARAPVRVVYRAHNMWSHILDLASWAAFVRRKWSSSLAGAKLRRGYEQPHPVRLPCLASRRQTACRNPLPSCPSFSMKQLVLGVLVADARAQVWI